MSEPQARTLQPSGTLADGPVEAVAGAEADPVVARIVRSTMEGAARRVLDLTVEGGGE